MILWVVISHCSWYSVNECRCKMRFEFQLSNGFATSHLAFAWFLLLLFIVIIINISDITEFTYIELQKPETLQRLHVSRPLEVNLKSSKLVDWTIEGTGSPKRLIRLDGNDVKKSNDYNTRNCVRTRFRRFYHSNRSKRLSKCLSECFRLPSTKKYIVSACSCQYK